MRGYFGVGVYLPKREINIGSLLRTANILGASFFFTIGRRYSPQCSDTMRTERHLPVLNYQTFEDFKTHLPYGCQLVGVELVERARLLEKFCHPERAAYLLGAEDYGIPQEVLSKCNHVIKLQGDTSMNVAVAGSIVCYHRISSRG